jgi:hypothetical protein
MGLNLGELAAMITKGPCEATVEKKKHGSTPDDHESYVIICTSMSMRELYFQKAIGKEAPFLKHRSDIPRAHLQALSINSSRFCSASSASTSVECIKNSL